MRKFLLMLLLLTFLICLGALAENTEDFNYIVNEEDVSIIEYTGDDTTVVVPDFIEGLPVRHIGYACFSGNSRLESITLPDGLLTIGMCAFENVSNVRTLVIPDTVTSSGALALAGMSSLEELTCPASVVAPQSNPWTCWWDSTNKPWNLKIIRINGSGGLHQELCSNLPKLETVILDEGITEIGHNAFADCPNLTTVQLPSTLKKVNSQSFGGCTALRQIQLPDGVTEIGDDAFSGCTALTTINLPTSLTRIGVQSFAGCTALRSLTFPPSLKTIDSFAFCNSGLIDVELPDTLETFVDGAFTSMPELKSLRIPSGIKNFTENTISSVPKLETLILGEGIESIGNMAFMKHNLPSLTTLSIPESVKTIGNSAFNGCTAIGPDLYLPNVTEIADWAFAGCTNLESVTLGDQLRRVPNSAFYECSGLTTVHIGSAVESIGSEAFVRCGALTTVNFPESLKTIDVYAFQDTGITEVNIPNATDLVYRTFYGCKNLKTLSLGGGLERIGPDAFGECSSLASVYLGDQLTTIGSDAFSNCTALVEINFPASLKTIDSGAFCNTALREVNLPDGLETIGAAAFKNNAYIRELVLPDSIQTAGHSILADMTSLESLTCPNIVLAAEPWTCWWNATNKPWNLKYLHITGAGEIHQELCSDLEKLETVIIDEGITTTGHNAFADCPSLTTVKLPSSLKEITSQSFSECVSLEEIRVPENVTTIGNFAFSDCSALVSVNLPDGLAEIGDYSFIDCVALSGINMPGTLKSIGEAAFERSGLVSLYLPDGIETLGYDAFEGMPNLKYLRVPGSLTEIGDSVFSNNVNLETLILCDGIEVIGEETFCRAGENTELNLRLPMTLREIKSGGLADIGVNSIALPNSLTTMHYDAFSSARSGKCNVYTTPSLVNLANGESSPPFPYGKKYIYWVVSNSAAHRSLKKGHSGTDLSPVIKTYGGSTGMLHLLDSETVLAPGVSYRIPVVFANPDMSVSFTSSAADIASVDAEGNVSAVAPGTAAITVAGGGKLVTFTVLVMLPADSVALDFSSITVSVGDTFRIPVSVSMPAGAPEWMPVATSNNANAAMVSGFVVSTVGTGAANITLADPVDADKTVHLTVNVVNDVIRLPDAVTAVRAEAFAGFTASCLTIPAGTNAIDERAFCDNPQLKLVRFDTDTVSIDDAAFDGCGDIFFLCRENSDAHIYAQQHDITCVFIP